jgi:hypothetical protein
VNSVIIIIVIGIPMLDLIVVSENMIKYKLNSPTTVAGY